MRSNFFTCFGADHITIPLEPFLRRHPMTLCFRSLLLMIVLSLISCTRPSATLGPQDGQNTAELPRQEIARTPNGSENVRREGSKDLKPTPSIRDASGRKQALLVGVTKYDKLSDRFHLKGPGNDVVLMRKMLKERFGFADKDIVTLSEGTEASGRPTRANIKSHFDRLARESGAADQVMILLAGHGSQQPDQEPFDEPDGLDETFLPCDAGPWDGGKEAVQRAIRS